MDIKNIKNFKEWFEAIVKRNPAKEAIIYHDEGKVITYEMLNRNVNKVANMLHYKLRLNKGDKLLVGLRYNTPEYIYLLLGAAKIGVITAHLNAEYKGKTLKYLINNSDAETIILDEYVYNNLQPLQATDLPKIKKVVFFDKFIDYFANIGYETYLFHDLFSSSSEDLPDIQTTLADPMAFLHTAGTTGPPKWCILSQMYYIAAGEALAKLLPMDPSYRTFNPLPLYHANPQVYFVMNSLAAGATMVLTKRFSVSQFWEIVAKYKVDVVILHPAIIGMVKKQLPEYPPGAISIKILFPADEELMRKYNIPVGIGLYGSTEAGAVTNIARITLPLPDKLKSLKKLSSFAGKPRDDIEVKVFDEHSFELPPYKIGEIVVRPKISHVIFDGYYNNPEKTAQAFRDLWFHTGDLGYMDEEGNLYFVQRAEESINVKGEFVPIDDVEGCLMEHPDVMEAAIVGVPGEFGDEIKAYIKLRPGSNVRYEDIINWCKERVAKFMIPRYIEFVDEFPRSTLGKIAKMELKQRGIGNAWDRVKAMGW
ncbi:MAG: AMP-binding protein [Nitrososphaeria archaeon]